VAAAAERGVDLTGHRSRVVPDDGEAADLVLVMEPAQVARAKRTGVSGVLFLCLGDLDPLAIDTRAIRDPFGRSPEVFRDCFARIDRCAAAVREASRLVDGGE
jgi:protein-tyrosine-phosphatase